MSLFREKRPKHRKGRAVCVHYKSYKKTLRTDFNRRCGYCDDLDFNRIRDFVIDHFVPRNPDGWKHRIKDNYYYNLVYACPFCNRAKSNKWPTKKTKVHNDGNEGFIMPTKRTYDKVFTRAKDGSIIYDPANPLSKYLYDNLDLWQPIHSLNWRFNYILQQEKILNTLYQKINDDAVKEQISILRDERLDIVDSINEIYNAK